MDTGPVVQDRRRRVQSLLLFCWVGYTDRCADTSGNKVLGEITIGSLVIKEAVFYSENHYSLNNLSRDVVDHMVTDLRARV